MHSPTCVSGSKRQSTLSNSSNLSTTASHSSHSASHASTAHSTAWVPYASMRAAGTVHNKIILRHRQQSLDSQQQQVAQLPTTPRRQHVYKPATPPLPPLKTAAEKKEDEVSTDETAAVSDGLSVQEEQKEAIDTQRSTGSSVASRPTTAGKSARSRRASTTTNKQPPPQPQSEPSPAALSTEPPQPTTPPLLDPLPEYLSVVRPSERLARLAQKREAAHAAVLDQFTAWQAAHKEQQRQHCHALATRFLAAHRSLTSAPTPSSLNIERLIADMQAGMERVVEEGLQAVAEAARGCVERLLVVGWKREGGIWAELRGAVEAWNVWTVRNRRSVAELVFLVRKEELERQEKESERLAKEAAEREKELAARQPATTVTVDATPAAAATLPAVATAT